MSLSCQINPARDRRSGLVSGFISSRCHLDTQPAVFFQNRGGPFVLGGGTLGGRGDVVRGIQYRWVNGAAFIIQSVLKGSRACLAQQKARTKGGSLEPCDVSKHALGTLIMWGYRVLMGRAGAKNMGTPASEPTLDQLMFTQQV